MVQILKRDNTELPTSVIVTFISLPISYVDNDYCREACDIWARIERYSKSLEGIGESASLSAASAFSFCFCCYCCCCCCYCCFWVWSQHILTRKNWDFMFTLKNPNKYSLTVRRNFAAQLMGMIPTLRNHVSHFMNMRHWECVIVLVQNWTHFNSTTQIIGQRRMWFALLKLRLFHSRSTSSHGLLLFQPRTTCDPICRVFVYGNPDGIIKLDILLLRVHNEACSSAYSSIDVLGDEIYC